MKNKTKGIIILIVLVLVNTVLAYFNLTTCRAKFYNTFIWGFLSAVVCVVAAIFISRVDK